MKCWRLRILGLLLSVSASACGGGGGGGNSAATVASCNAYCDALVAKNCPLPIYDSLSECKMAECAGLGAAPAKCLGTLKTYYDCQTSQADICEGTGCDAQFTAVLTCATGSSAGTGGQTGATGGAGGGIGGAGGAASGATGGTSGQWTPAALGARLVVWLDASQETAATNGAKISTWTDHSGAGNNATQSLATNRPTFTAAGINGLPSVTFDGSVTFFQIPDAPTLRWGTGDFAVMVVARGAPNLSSNAMLYQKSELGSPFAGLNLFLNSTKPVAGTKAAIQVDGDFYVTTRDDFGDNLPHIIGGRLLMNGTAATLEIRVDGARQGTVSVSPPINIDAPAQAAIIGHNGYNPSPGFQAFKGDLSEIVAVKGTLGDGELASLEAYLKTKYRVP